jgi:hypothetical protein
MVLVRNEANAVAVRPNSRVRGRRAAKLGWAPRRRSITEWIANELT